MLPIDRPLKSVRVCRNAPKSHCTLQNRGILYGANSGQRKREWSGGGSDEHRMWS